MPEFIPEHTPHNLDAFTRGYLDAAEWLLDEEIDRAKIRGWTKEAITRAKKDCAAFQADNAALLDQYRETYLPKGGYDVDECAGHDFYLTRCGHGTGFWDRGLGDLGDKLADAARRYRRGRDRRLSRQNLLHVSSLTYSAIRLPRI